MKMLLTGAGGQVGSELVALCAEGDVELLALNRNGLDITDPVAVAQCITHSGVDFVVNAAAHTAVDRAEEERELAMAINRDGCSNLASACADNDIPLIHISTDYVFDGEKGAPYTEEDAAAPLNVYGESKWLGEEAVRQCWRKHIILRTSWVFGEQGNNFAKTILRLATQRQELRIVADQQGAPTSAREIAACILNICRQLHKSGSDELWGSYHFSGTPFVSWHQFAEKIVEYGRRAGIVDHEVRLLPIPASEYPTSARRPMDTRLDCSKIERCFGFCSRDWNGELQRMIPNLLSPSAEGKYTQQPPPFAKGD